MKSFKKIQTPAIQFNQLTPNIALALSKTAMEISSAAIEARSGTGRRELDDSGTQTIQNLAALSYDTRPLSAVLDETRFIALKGRTFSNPWHSGPAAISETMPTFAQQFRLACVIRSRQVLSSPDTSFSDIHPSLSL